MEQVNRIDELRIIAKRVRQNIVKMYFRAGWGHMAPALSCVEILISICFGENENGNQYYCLGKDRLILSKGHGCAALYAVFAELGVIDKSELNTFYQDDSRLIGLASPTIGGIDIPTGSLGHGICFATGVALSNKLDGSKNKVYVVLGDGESQEGSVWEAAEFAGVKKLDNLIVVLDRNRMQASDRIDSIIPIDPVSSKWMTFGWNIIESSGHEFDDLLNAINRANACKDKPSLIIANTIKGKGVGIAENRPEWHSRAPRGEEWKSVCKDIGISLEDLELI